LESKTVKLRSNGKVIKQNLMQAGLDFDEVSDIEMLQTFLEFGGLN